MGLFLPYYFVEAEAVLSRSSMVTLVAQMAPPLAENLGYRWSDLTHFHDAALPQTATNKVEDKNEDESKHKGLV